jgi:hypothetical protein
MSLTTTSPIALCGVLLAVLGLAGSADARRPSLRVSRTVVSPGQRVRITGNADGCPRGDTVLILSQAFRSRANFAGVPAVSTPVRRGGAFSASATIRRVDPGLYRVSARCGGGNLDVYGVLQVRRR